MTYQFARAVRYVPTWFPGAGWKIKAEQYRGLLEEMLQAPFQLVKRQMVSVGFDV